MLFKLEGWSCPTLALLCSLWLPKPIVNGDGHCCYASCMMRSGLHGADLQCPWLTHSQSKSTASSDLPDSQDCVQEAVDRWDCSDCPVQSSRLQHNAATKRSLGNAWVLPSLPSCFTPPLVESPNLLRCQTHHILTCQEVQNTKNRYRLSLYNRSEHVSKLQRLLFERSLRLSKHCMGRRTSSSGNLLGSAPLRIVLPLLANHGMEKAMHIFSHLTVRS